LREVGVVKLCKVGTKDLMNAGDMPLVKMEEDTRKRQQKKKIS